MADNFLPKDYEVPETGGKYMKFQIGENHFRVLDSAIVGTEGWVTTEEGRKPIRKRPSEPMSVTEVDDPSDVKHFWAFPVWNYKAERVQILEITQKTIQRAMRAYVNDDDWGDPKTYDFKVIREGEGMDTEYTVKAIPHSELSDEAKEAWENTTINLEALYEGEDPFEETYDVDDIEEVLDE